MNHVYISGASGRMGKSIISLQDQYDWFSIVDDITAANLVIDFSSPQGFLQALSSAQQQQVPFVSGTTGLNAEHLQALDAAAGNIPVLWSANMSIGMNLLYQLTRQVAEQLPDADAEIIETHHRYKQDAPSGSALRLAEQISKARDQQLSAVAAYDRTRQTKARQTDEIGFSVIRAGDVVGEHTALFAVDGERLELTHRATDRTVFARGALHAAQWLTSQPAGLYHFYNSLSR